VASLGSTWRMFSYWAMTCAVSRATRQLTRTASRGGGRAPSAAAPVSLWMGLCGAL
jgi:hypothetical protein